MITSTLQKKNHTGDFKGLQVIREIMEHNYNITVHLTSEHNHKGYIHTAAS